MTNCRLLLVTDAVGGVWTYSVELAKALRPLGTETVLAVTGPPPGADKRDAAGSIRILETGLPLEWLDTTASEIIRASEELAKIASREAAEIVQTSSAALLAGASFDCPTVAVQHSCVTTWWQAVKGTALPKEFEWRRELVARGLERADAVLAPSVAFAEETARAYALARPVVAVHNGRSGRDVRALPQGDFVFTAGRLWDEGKNAAVLDRAAERICAPVHAAGATEGPNGARISLNHLSLLGELPADKMAGLLAARPVFASAALYEPFGLSVLEAARAGCALVLSDIPTHRELWGGAAIFVDARDERGFADATNALLRDRTRRNALGGRALEHAQRYTPQAMARATAAVHAQVMQPQLLAGAA